MTIRACPGIGSQCQTLDAIITAVAEHFGCTHKEMTSASRVYEISHPRQIAMHLCHRLVGASTVHIGGHLGSRDHSTVLYGIRKYDGKDLAAEVHDYDDLIAALDLALPHGITGDKQIPVFRIGDRAVWTRHGHQVKVLAVREARATVSYRYACGRWAVAERSIRELVPAPVAASA